MQTMRSKQEEQNKKKDKSGKKPASKRDPGAPAFRDARARKAESRTAETGDPSVP